MNEISIGTRWHDSLIKLFHEESQTEIEVWNNIKHGKYLINFPTQERCDAFKEFLEAAQNVSNKYDMSYKKGDIKKVVENVSFEISLRLFGYDYTFLDGVSEEIGIDTLRIGESLEENIKIKLEDILLYKFGSHLEEFDHAIDINQMKKRHDVDDLLFEYEDKDLFEDHGLWDWDLTELVAPGDLEKLGFKIEIHPIIQLYRNNFYWELN